MNELGVRYKCYKCQTKFYDLTAPQPICPSCGENQNDDQSKKPSPRQKKKMYRLISKEAIDVPHETEGLEGVAGDHDEAAYSQAAEDIDHIADDHEEDAASPEE